MFFFFSTKEKTNIKFKTYSDSINIFLYAIKIFMHVIKDCGRRKELEKIKLILVEKLVSAFSMKF